MESINYKDIIIIGGGRRGLAALEILKECENVKIKAVIDDNGSKAGIKQAEHLGIKTDTDWEKYIESERHPAAVLNLSDKEKLQKKLIEKTKGKEIEVLGNVSREMMIKILAEWQVYSEFHKVSKNMATDIEMDELMVLILSSCVKSVGADGGIIALYNRNTDKPEVKSTWQVKNEEAEKLREKITKWLAPYNSKKEKGQICESESLSSSGKLGYVLCAPLRTRGEILGAITVSYRKNREPDVGAKRLLTAFANQAAAAVQNIILYKKTQRLSMTDGLTGVHNYRYFQKQMDKELLRAQRYDLNFSIIIIDLDNFKKINDTYGHPEGDKVLKAVSKFIKKMVRKTDIVARYGGDEFSVILPATPKRGAVILGERIRKRVIKNKALSSRFKISLSVGVSSYPEDGVHGEEILKKADKALYRAKESGRNKTCAA